MRREGSDEGREKERFHRVSCLRGMPFPGSAHEHLRHLVVKSVNL